MTPSFSLSRLKPAAKKKAKPAAVTPAPQKAAPPPPKPPKAKKPARHFFSLDPVTIDYVADERAAHARYVRLVRIVTFETITLAVLGGFLIVGTPFFRPVYQYYALNPQHEVMQLVALTVPNMTNRAILSWATTTTTEIMTIGFGDFESKLAAQEPRFTPEGWESFKKAFIRQKIGETFKKNQLVLTTVPSDTPVIVAQGVNEQQAYEWIVQMPVIMTFATNNNVTQREKAIINLTIVRVPAEYNPSGIGIAAWSLKS